MVLTNLIASTVYINVLCVTTLPVSIMVALLVHTLVNSLASYYYDGVLTLLVVTMTSLLGWCKENTVDHRLGVNNNTNSTSLVLSMVLVVLSEAALFVSILWVVVLVLVSTHSSYIEYPSLLYNIIITYGTTTSGVHFQNALTIINTDLLLFTGVLSVVVVHCNSTSTMLYTHSLFTYIIILGGVFVVVQCCEYVHLYWNMFSAGTAMMFYVTTGIHGTHVLIGVMLLTGYWVQLIAWGLYNNHDTMIVGGMVSIILYWHFVDCIWVGVVCLVYWTQLIM
uniref:Cytochrome c oxidase subunit 3 n=1 Tax=Sulcionema specki TaxID=2016126 RepID=A0A6G5ZV60_9EUGL|nr:cytochrome c oxidase subunit 3 [Sulcionema specki]